MVLNGLDSASRLNAAAAHSAGYVAWGRYLTGNYAMVASEVTDATAHGIGVWSIFEAGAQNALGGAGQAAIDAQKALQAATALHQPKGSALYCAVDFDPTAAQIGDVVAYCRAFVQAVRSDGYKGGVYGGASVVKALTGKADYLWQAAGWSYGVDVPGCQIRQKVATIVVGGVTCDLDILESNDYGAWNNDGLFPKPLPHPVPPTPHPTPDPTEEAVIHTVIGKIPGNGRVIIDTPVPWANRIAATAQTEDGAQSVASVQWTNAAGNVRLVVEGTPNKAVSIDVAATK